MSAGKVRQFVSEQTWTSSKGDLGSVVWKGAIALAQFIANRAEKLRGGRPWGETTAVEIGAGAAALPSMVAALSGIDCLCTELPKVLEWAKHNVSLNLSDEGDPDDVHSDPHAKMLLHYDVLDWGKTEPNNNLPRPYDYVFAADCLYATAAEPDLFKKLIQTLQALLQPGSPTILYMCYVNRQQHFEHTFFGTTLPDLGFDCVRMPWVVCTSMFERRAMGGPNAEEDFDREKNRKGGSEEQEHREMRGECILMEIRRTSPGKFLKPGADTRPKLEQEEQQSRAVLEANREEVKSAGWGRQVEMTREVQDSKGGYRKKDPLDRRQEEEEDPFWSVEMMGDKAWRGDGQVEWVVPDDDDELCMLELRKREFINHCNVSGIVAAGVAESELWRTAQLEVDGGDADGEFNGFVGSVEVFSFNNKIQSISSSSSSSESSDEAVVQVDVKIRSLDGDGVLCDVGGEVWEASICLSCWLLLQQRPKPDPVRRGHLDVEQLGQGASAVDWDWRGKHVLELGAGLGLCGLALAKGVEGARVTMTDFDDTLLCNLLHNARINKGSGGSGGSFSGGGSCSIGSEVTEAAGVRIDVGAGVEIARLDWSEAAFSSENGGSENGGSENGDSDTGEISISGGSSSNGGSSNGSSNGSSIAGEKFDYLVGSELVYAPHHALMLASVIGHYMKRGAQAAYVLNQPTRPGVAQFVKQLQSRFGLQVITSSLPAGITAACSRSSGMSSENGGGGSGGSYEDLRLYTITPRV
jgi:predicted nicotinamide N-methyase